MGNICCLFRTDKKTELGDLLIREFHCYKCNQTYLSNNEYNRHIIGCNEIYGDL